MFSVIACAMLAVIAAAGLPSQVFAASASGGGAFGVAAVPAPSMPGGKMRTPVRIEVLAGRDWPGGDLPKAVAAAQAPAQVRNGVLETWVGVLPDGAILPDGVRRENLLWSTSPMAIMRTDTDIRSWSALEGRTVCLSADGRHVGEVATRFGAIEQIHPAAADALLALRTGQCDAAVEDEDFLRALLEYTEWHKFSAQLAPYRQLRLVALFRGDLVKSERDALEQTLGAGRLHALAQGQARDIAFEVYLEQVVPDCH